MSHALLSRRVLLAALLVGVSLLLAARFLVPRGPAAAEVSAPVVVRSERAVASKLFVHVVGAVRRPGLYRLREGSRVADAVVRAGGLARSADPALVNLAAPVGDGQQVVVPFKVVAGQPGSQSAPAAPTGPVQLSTATPEQLDELPGIGPATAAKILQYRDEHGPFRSVDDLDAVPGIGPTRVEQLRELVVP
jgi:competence protein ComEA